MTPDPSHKVNDEQFAEMAQEYMERMGYDNQPYIVFKQDREAVLQVHAKRNYGTLGNYIMAWKELEQVFPLIVIPK